MSFTEEYLVSRGIKRVLHIGADRGGELPQYNRMAVDEVVWVEANPDVYKELLLNLKAMNIKEVKSIPFNQLLSYEDDVETDFNIIYGHDAGHMVGNKGMSSLLKPRHSWWGSECYRGTIKLNSLTVDTFLERNNLGNDFDMVNIDTQGAELMILSGAMDFLSNPQLKYLNVEVTFSNPQYEQNPLFDQINALLIDYRFKHVHTELSGERTWGDALYVRE